jgi:hypothetical protein
MYQSSDSAVATEVKELLRRATKVISDFDGLEYGCLGFRSVWLYYGNKAVAAKALKISIADYKAILSKKCQLTRRASLALYELPDDAYDIVIHGSWMMMEMSEAGRAALFPDTSALPLSKQAYIKSVEAWREIQVERWGAKPDERYGFPVKAAYMLLQAYVTGHECASRSAYYDAWLIQSRGCGFFNGGASRALRQADKFRSRIKDAAPGSELYAVALCIIRDYETYCSERAARKAAVDKHVKAQRNVVDSKRDEFLTALEERDGLCCKACGSVEKLQIDHILPVSLGGLSELDNLQLLCSLCNNSKGDREMDYLYRRIARRKGQPSDRSGNNHILGIRCEKVYEE